jgi:cation:H+ antiporter
MAGSLALFAASLLVTLLAARTFATHLDELGVRLGLPEAFVGLLTALAADGPEIASSLTALVKGDRSVSLGVVVGSNLFNLAAMVGASALLVGYVRVRREALLLEGTVAALASAIVAALVLGGIPVAVAMVLLAAVLLPYLALLVRGAELAERVPLPATVAGSLMRALSERTGVGEVVPPAALPAGGDVPPAAARGVDRGPAGLHWRTPVFIAGSVLLVLGGSVGMVETALSLATRWQVPSSAVGFLILAPLTSIPNAATAMRLGIAGRGSALVSDTFNSNTINLVAGVAVPALFISVGNGSASVVFDLLWLTVMTGLVLWLLAQPSGIGRRGGAVLVLLYGTFVVIELLLG